MRSAYGPFAVNNVTDGGVIGRRMAAVTGLKPLSISTMVRAAPAIQSIEPYVWLVFGLAAIPSVALWTWLGRRLGNAPAFAIAAILEGLGVAMSVLATGPLEASAEALAALARAIEAGDIEAVE